MRRFFSFQNLSILGRKPDKAPLRLSACLFALNDGPVIARALRSLRDQADEVVLIDGGSTDDTVAIARAAGARVVVEPWQTDSTGARQAAVAAATGDWLFFMAGDETLESGNRTCLRTTIRETRTTKIVIGVSDEAHQEFGEQASFRLLHRNAMFPIPRPAQAPIHSILHPEIKVRKWHALPAYRTAKIQRKLELLELLLAAQSDNLLDRIEAIKCRRALALRYWCDDLVDTLSLTNWTHSTGAHDDHLVTLLELALLAPESALPPGSAHSALASIASQKFPRHCHLAWLSSWRWSEAGQWVQAIAAAERAQRLWQARSFDDPHPFDPSFIYDQLPALLERAQPQLLRPAALPRSQPMSRPAFRHAVPIHLNLSPSP